jgi:hypothetical protein
MRKVDAVFVTRRFVVVERECLTRGQCYFGVGKFADAKLRSLQVTENTDRATRLLLDRADALDQGTHHFMAGMAHVDTEEVSACFVELLDHCLFRRCRTERGKDLYFAVTPHQFWPSCVPGVSDSWTIQLP